MVNPVNIGDPEIVIVGVGAVTTLGGSFATSLAALRAQICATQEHPFLVEKRGERMVMGMVEWFEPTMPLGLRMIEMAIGAASDCLGSVNGKRDAVRSKLHLVVPHEKWLDAKHSARLLDEVRRTLRVNEAAELNRDGHAGCFGALERAIADLRAGRADLCYVGGVDSYIDVDRLEELDDEDRLHSPSQTWGITPAEGAGFMAVTTGAGLRRGAFRALSLVRSVATAREKNLRGTRTVCIAEGLSAAFRAALKDDVKIAHTYCDMNGEPYRADEFAFSVCRTSERFVTPDAFTTPAACWGEVGAASGVLSMMLAAVGASRDWHRAKRTLAWGSSAEAPLRGAATFQRIASLRD